MSYRGLSYQQRVLLGALEISRESKGTRGYEFSWAGEDLILEPWNILPIEGRTSFPFVKVTGDDIFGKSKYVVELRAKERALFREVSSR